MMKLLLRFGANVEETDGTYHGTALLTALAWNKPAALQVLLDTGASQLVQDRHQMTAVHHAAKSGIANRQFLELFLESGVPCNAQDILGSTGLHYAIRECPENIEAVRKLLECGANPNLKDHDGFTSLHLAIPAVDTLKSTDLVSKLLDHGADVQASTSDGRTPLHFAVLLWILPLSANDDEEVLRLTKILDLLLNRGVTASPRDNRGQTPLHQSRTFVAIRYLSRRGADVNAFDVDGRTPLHYTSQGNMARMVGFDISGSILNARRATQQGMRLPELASKSRQGIIPVLLDLGADLNARDKSGKSPLHFATDRFTFDELVSGGADPEVQDLDGVKPNFRRQQVIERIHTTGDPRLAMDKVLRELRARRWETDDDSEISDYHSDGTSSDSGIDNSGIDLIEHKLSSRGTGNRQVSETGS